MRSKVFITGVSRGLGYALAREALARGFPTIGIGRHSAEDLDGHGDYQFIQADFADESSVQSAAKQLCNHPGRIQLGILNAGMLNPIQDMVEASLEEVKKAMQINVWANKTLLDALLQTSEPPKQIVAISSGASQSGSRGWNAYAISKAALNMLVQLYAAEARETHFAAVAPGLVDTGMQEAIANTPDDPRFPKMRELKDARGTAKMPTPQELAPQLWNIFSLLPKHHASGHYVDIRKITPEWSQTS